MPMRAQSGGVGVAPTHSQPDARSCVASTTLRLFYSMGRPSTHCTGGWLGLGAGLDWHGIFHPHRESTTAPSTTWLVAIPTELTRSPASYGRRRVILIQPPTCNMGRTAEVYDVTSNYYLITSLSYFAK